MSTTIDSGSGVYAFEALTDMYDYNVDDTTGTLPDGLTGTLYRNGPGKLEAGGQPLGHIFDGDGMLSMFTLTPDGIRYRNRYVNTNHYRRSLTSKGAPFRALGTMRPGGPLANALRFPANVANTNVVLHAGKLLALWEAGPPHEIDPDSLDTVGPYRFGDGLRWLGAFSAHPKFDPQTGEMYNFGIAVTPKPILQCYRVAPTGSLSRLAAVPLPGPLFNHDVALTKRHMVFVLDPMMVNLTDAALSGLGLKHYIDAIRFEPSRGTTIALVPRDGGKPTITHTDALMHFHVNNAYDEGTDTVVELVAWNATWEQINAQLQGMQGGLSDDSLSYGGHLVRLRITAGGKVIREQASHLQGEFPQFNQAMACRRHRYSYLAVGADGALYPNAVGKFDHERNSEVLHRLPDGHSAHEPLFVARPGADAEDDGWLLALTQNPHDGRARLLVLDARAPQRDPLFTATLRHHIPPTFHGSFTTRLPAWAVTPTG